MTPLLLANWGVHKFVELQSERLVVSDSEPRVLDIDFRSRADIVGSVAVIPVHGVIDYRATFMSDYGYCCSGEAIRQDFNRLVADETIEKIVFDISSPGGVYSGMPELAADVFASRGKKTTIAVANPQAASGALWLGAAAEQFFVLGSGQVGSLGALMLHTDMSKFYEAGGIEHTILRSPEGKADFNPIEPLSPESREHHQQQIDAIAAEFTAAVAKYRGVNKKVAAESFGEGRMLDGPKAIDAGLVDGIVSSLSAVLGSKAKTTKRARLHPRMQLAKVKGDMARSRVATG